MRKIIDISEFQGDVDFIKVKADGINGVIIRCGLTGYGAAKSKYVDAWWERHYAAAKAAEMDIGAYYYSCAYTPEEAESEAAFVAQLLKDKQLSLPVFWDTEDTHDVHADGVWPQNQLTIGKAQLTACAKAFLSAIRKAGYYAGIYGSTSWLSYQLAMDQIDAPAVWVAQYYQVCQYKGSYDMWQYTSSGAVSGVTGSVDVSECYADYPAAILAAGLNGFTQPDEAGKSIAVLATEVMAGKWGNGTERVQRLTAAGYDYQAVQEEVNRRLAVSAPPAPASFRPGDRVRLSASATIYGTPQKFASWLYKMKLYVREVSGGRIVISVFRIGPITGAVDVRYLSKA